MYELFHKFKEEEKGDTVKYTLEEVNNFEITKIIIGDFINEVVPPHGFERGPIDYKSIS